MDFKRLRIQYFRKWEPKISIEHYNNSLLFPVEKNYLERIKNEFFVPYRFKYRVDENYNKQLSFMIDALEFLPLRPDLAFDSMFKSLESSMSYIDRGNRPGSTTNTTDLLTLFAEVLESKIASNQNLSLLTDKLYNYMPVQVYEYIVKKSLGEFDPSVPFKANGSSYKRIALISPNIEGLITVMSGIYGHKNNNLEAKETRNASMLIRKLMIKKDSDEKIKIPKGSNNVYMLDEKEKLKLIASGLLYTYRNDRFHANTFSPFKSSKATIKTYAFAHFAFLFAYYLVLLLVHEENPEKNKLKDIYYNLNYNLDLFKDIYGRHLKG
ncbi:hypothetical protein [Sporosarcina sp. UB5]|uniref:hypothetical protein n=1 Tax=Sporosarcina sp. UB5 TaxID=3047463 RepID=UPI003D7AAB9C